MVSLDFWDVEAQSKAQDFDSSYPQQSVANRQSLDRFCFFGNDLDTEKEERRFKINFHITYDQFYFSGILKTAW